MQPWSGAVGEREIVHVALAVHPGGDDAAVATVLLGILGHAEAEQRIELDRVLQLGREDVEVVEPLRLHALVVSVELEQALALLHLEIELERRAERIDRLQGPALIRYLDKPMAQAFGGEERGRFVEILLAADLEADPLARRRRGFLEHQGMMLALLDPAQVGLARRTIF